MANTVFKIRRSSVAGKVPTTTDISIGELGINLTDRILYSSDGTNIWSIGSNNLNISVTGNATINAIIANGSLGTSAQVLTSNSTGGIYWATPSAGVNTAAQYTWTNTHTFSNAIYANTVNAVSYTVGTAAFVANTSGVYTNNGISLTNNNTKLSFATVNASAYAYFTQQNDDNFVFYTTNTAYGQRPVWSIFANSITSNLNFSVPVNFAANVGALTANGTTGSAGQILASNGTSTYWVTPGAAAVNTAAQFTWTNTHTFNANVSFNAPIGLATNTALYFNAVSDANWRIARNSNTLTKWVYTGNTIDIVTANSTNEGFTIGLGSNATYFETGYLGTYIVNKVTVGNSTSNSTINSTAIAANTITVGSSTTATFTNINGQVNASPGNFIANAYAYLGGYGGNYLAFGQQSNFHQWIQSGYSASGAVYYSIILNPLGGNTGIGNTAPVDKLSVNGTTYLGANVNILGTVLLNGSNGTVGQVLTSNGTGNAYWSTVSGGVNTAAQYTWTNTHTFSANVTTNASLLANTVNAVSYSVGTAFTANSTLVNAYSLVVATNTSTFGTSTYIVANGNVGILTNAPAYNLQVNGSFAAVTKSFVIDHPSKSGMKLRYASLEGPENGVYLRGRLTGNNTIEYPDYWTSLVDMDSITVSLTPIGKSKMPSVGKITDNGIEIIGKNIDCYYHVFAERKDVEKLLVEF
jgi:hypothetical protein